MSDLPDAVDLLHTVLVDGVARWKSGELDGVTAHKLLDTCRYALDNLASDDQRRDRFVLIWDGIVDEIARQRDEKLAAMPIESAWRNHNNVMPVWHPINPAGTVNWCCSCGAGHLSEYRVIDGQLEEKTYLLPKPKEMN